MLAWRWERHQLDTPQRLIESDTNQEPWLLSGISIRATVEGRVPLSLCDSSLDGWDRRAHRSTTGGAQFAISNCTVISSFTFTVPPATVIGSMPKSRCLITT